MLWKNDDEVIVKESCNNFIDFEVTNDQVGRWRYTILTGIQKRRRSDSRELIRNLADKSLFLWCIIDDFNDLMNMEEKKGGNPHPKYLCVLM